MRKLLTTGALAVLLAAGLNAEVLEQILVKVNGEIITKTDLEQRQIAALRDLPNQPDPSRMTDADLAKALAEVTPTVIVEAVDELLLLQRAKEIGLAVTDEQFNTVLESIKKDNKMETDAQFQAALKQEGMTLATLRKSLERRMLISQVQSREIAGRGEVTEAEERAYYEAHPSEFAAMLSVTLREILVAIPNDPKGINVAAAEEATAKAEAIRARVVAGESFEKLVAELSDAPSKANGGLIGPIPKNELAEELMKILATLKVGEVTPLVRVPNGIEILKLESSIESTTLPFDQARNQIAERLSFERQQAEVVKYLKKLRDQAIIEWKNDEARKAYDAGVAAQATPAN
ncbi:MAG: hypothetical protein EXQ55_02835 [Acidobacteria bacterium]|nr:hypothetical protein [Acidobacteriota bacterium]